MLTPYLHLNFIEMTNSELNRDVKRLLKAYKSLDSSDSNKYFEAIDSKIKPEFLRLYRADDTLESFNKSSLLIMIRLNNRFRFVPLHQFGLYINI